MEPLFLLRVDDRYGNKLIREVIYNGSQTQLVENEQNYRLTIERLEEY